MSQATDSHRRRFLGAAALTLAAAGSNLTSATLAQPGRREPAPTVPPSFGPIRQVDAGVLNVGFDWGARTACIVAALWPERCQALVSVNGYLINNLERNKLPLPPQAEWGWWYQYYFATERGRAGYAANRRDFARLIWRNVSPKWNFDEAAFNRTAASLDNPDHVDIVIHNYRWRLSLAPGELQYDGLEKRLAAGPVIAVPTITLDGDSDGVAPATDGTAHANMFSGRRTHRIIPGAGHNLPQEAPRAFAEAILEVAGYAG